MQVLGNSWIRDISMRNNSNHGRGVFLRYGGDGHVRLAKRMVSYGHFASQRI
jgi:hypothetical protein